MMIRTRMRRKKMADAQNYRYWPMAISLSGEKLWTYDCVLSLREAEEQIEFWESECGYIIKEAWVDRSDGKRIELKKAWVRKN